MLMRMPCSLNKPVPGELIFTQRQVHGTVHGNVFSIGSRRGLPLGVGIRLPIQPEYQGAGRNVREECDEISHAFNNAFQALVNARIDNR